MKKIISTIIICLFSTASQADDFFTGDVRLACEAMLCLSSGSRPSECSPSLKRYYDIRKIKLSDTLKARQNFLNGCPSANTDNVKSLVNSNVNLDSSN